MYKKGFNVVMLPTNEKAIIGDLALSHNNVLNFAKNEDWLVIYNPINQHIYITSDEEIKEGDSFLSDRRNSIYENNGVPVYELFKCTSIFNKWIGINDNKDLGLNPTWSKKVIATTNNDMSIFDLLLPQPSQQFIEKYIEEYNKGNVITKVMVEYEDIKTCIVCGASQMKEYKSCHYPKGGNTCCGGSLELKIKVNPDNTINTKPIKENWSREEVVELFHKYKIDHDGEGSYYKDILNKWVEKNL